jgi:hypothetical protein
LRRRGKTPDEGDPMSEPQIPSQNPHMMLDWLEQRRLDLIAAYRAALIADGQTLSVEQLNDAVERWSDFAIGRSRTLAA